MFSKGFPYIAFKRKCEPLQFVSVGGKPLRMLVLIVNLIQKASKVINRLSPNISMYITFSSHIKIGRICTNIETTFSPW